MEKCVVLFSGGLDSRLAIKLMQEKGFKVIATYFKLPFSCSCLSEAEEFVKKEKINLKVFDCTKGKLFKNYLKIIKEGKHGRGAGFNPCIDCKIFMFKKAKKFADSKKIKYIVSGEVTGQRPMSQKKKQIELIEKETKLKDRIIRPLIELGISGRQRKEQISLAKKLGIKYPSPAGGCLLCEKLLKERFKKLFQRGLNNKETLLTNSGRHFLINGCWVVLGKNKEENKFLKEIGIGELIEPEFIGPTALILDKCDKDTRGLIEELIYAYSKKASLEDRKKFEEFKL